MDKKSRINVQLDTPLYTGSVQNLYEVPDHPELLISETTNGGSVFDVGTIFSIAGSDVARASFRHFVYQELHKPSAWQDIAEYLTQTTQSQQLTENPLFETRP